MLSNLTGWHVIVLLIPVLVVAAAIVLVLILVLKRRSTSPGDLLLSAASDGAYRGGASPRVVGPNGSVDGRLQQLDDLLSRDLITRSEYDTKRAEILDEL